MEKTTARNYWLTSLAILLVLPAAYFIMISILKYGLSVNGPYDTSEPLLANLGFKENLGSNQLILVGPVIALFLTTLQVLAIDWKFKSKKFQFRFTVQKKWFPLVIAVISGLILASLAFYFIGENINLAESNNMYYAK